MKLVTRVILATAALVALGAAAAQAAPYLEEHVTGGVLDLVWHNGFNTSNNMQPLTLDGTSPAYANPSGDHTVAVATNSVPDSGGIIVTAIDAQGVNDYEWHVKMFTGDGNTRRGVIVRATPSVNPTNFYMFVIESGLFQIRFRKFVAGTPTTLATWFANSLPGGPLQLNQWIDLRVIAIGNNFRCFINDFELTTTPIVDAALPNGDVGCYNFRFDLGDVSVYYDDLLLTSYASTPSKRTTFGQLKALYR